MNAQKLHPLQEAILRLAQDRNLAKLTLREIGRLVGDSSPQKIKHHLQQLEKRGLLKMDREKKTTQKTMHGWIDGFLKKGKRLLRIPIVGAANCGPAELLAEQNIVGYLRISSSLIGRRVSEGLFAVRADGFSMNQARLNAKTINDGDYLIVDGNDRAPKEGQIILSIIDGAANVKRYHHDKENNQIVLMSDSTEDLAPIYIHPDDDFLVNGRVVDVIKRPAFNSRVKS
jgi:repressor LexA